LTAQLQLYISGDVAPEEKSIVQTFIDALLTLQKNLLSKICFSQVLFHLIKNIPKNSCINR